MRLIVLFGLVALAALVAACAQQQDIKVIEPPEQNVDALPDSMQPETPAPEPEPVAPVPEEKPPGAPLEQEDFIEEEDLKEGECPIVSTDDVMLYCVRSTTPVVKASATACEFAFNGDALEVSAVEATVQEYQEWENTEGIYYTGELGENSARGEIKGMRYFGWFNGEKLIIVQSTGTNACTGDRLDELVGIIGGAPASKTKQPYKSVTYG